MTIANLVEGKQYLIHLPGLKSIRVVYTSCSGYAGMYYFQSKDGTIYLTPDEIYSRLKEIEYE